MLTLRGRRYVLIGVPVAALAVWAGLVIALVVVPANAPPANGPPCICPLATPIALGTPNEQVWGSHHWYNFSIQSAESGLLLGGFAFQVVTSTGGLVPPTSAWTLGVLGSSGAVVGAYSFTTSGWTAGGGDRVAAFDTVVLDSGSTNLGGQGDSLNVLGNGSVFQGSLSITIP
jgi:hypothetical protein